MNQHTRGKYTNDNSILTLNPPSNLKLSFSPNLGGLFSGSFLGGGRVKLLHLSRTC